MHENPHGLAWLEWLARPEPVATAPLGRVACALPQTGKIGVTPAGGACIMPRMPRVVFTQQLRRFALEPSIETAASTLRHALEDAFVPNPRLRGYVLDDQGHVRANVVIFIDGRRSADHTLLADALAPGSEVHVLQALSGG